MGHLISLLSHSRMCSFTSRLKQLDEFKKKVENEWHEMAKPLARYKDDKDLDELLKQQEREEDPMLAFIKKSKEKSKEKKKGEFCYFLDRFKYDEMHFDKVFRLF